MVLVEAEGEQMKALEEQYPSKRYEEGAYQ